MNCLEIYPKNAKILLIGPIPPPFGGVSVHIKRLISLAKKNGHDTHSFYTSKKYRSKILNSMKLTWLIFKKNYDIIHVQGYFRAYMLVIFVIRFIRGYKIYFTDHNPRLFENKRKGTVFLIKKFIEKLDYLIVVSNHVLDGYRKNNVMLPRNLLIQNAFLPPNLVKEEVIFQRYSQKAKDFISLHSPLIIANGQIVFYNNHDLYGLDLCIQLTQKLKNNFPQIGFIFVLSREDNKNDYLRKMNNQINKRNIENNFLIMIGQGEIWPLIKRSDLSVRPTMSDGDALSIREALFFKCPVIASDVTPRPNGTILFKSRDIEDLYYKSMEVLQNKSNSD
jgi:glycosyltransferase involved in cell wall biosynthesis